MAAEPPEARDSPDDVVGQPDVRFSYENERTFRAWIRRVIGLPLIALGVVIAIASLINWRANEHAMKAGLPLPRSPLRRSRQSPYRWSQWSGSYLHASQGRASERSGSRWPRRDRRR